MQVELSDRAVMNAKRKFGANGGECFKDARKQEQHPAPTRLRPAITSLRRYPITSLLQIFTQLHSFEYGTRLMRYPDFTPVTT
jgi:hypothetical protein